MVCCLDSIRMFAEHEHLPSNICSILFYLTSFIPEVPKVRIFFGGLPTVPRPQQAPKIFTARYSMVAFAGLHNHHMEQLRTCFLFADRGSSSGVSCFEFVELRG